MHQVRSIQHREQLPMLAACFDTIAPHEYSASGIFDISNKQLQLGHSNYGKEHTQLYETQGYKWDPAIHLLEATQIGTVSSEDLLDLEISKEVVGLKLDAGIKECLTVGVRGALGLCTYFAFSNFDQQLMNKFRTMMQILGPHLHLAYIQATSSTNDCRPLLQIPSLTAREEEIMRWVAEGKTNWEISIILHVSLNTIKFHLKNVYYKLGGVENRWAAVAQWQRNSSGPTPLHKPTSQDNAPETTPPPL
ncbi:MAG: LuxR C-terminal-related transcriptional regulator [Nitrospiraceae bacterium]